MDSSGSDEDSWSTIGSSVLSDDSFECSTCTSSDDEDCSYKREESASCPPGDRTSIPAAVRRPKFARKQFVLKEKTENDLEEVFGRCEDDDEEEMECYIGSSSSCSSGSEEEEECHTEKWTASDTRKNFPFTATPAMNTGSAQTPLDFFHLLFNPDFMQFLVDSINTRGKELAQKKKMVYLETDVEELYTLLCTHFMMGFTDCIKLDILFGHRPSLNVDFNTYLRRDRYLLLFTLLNHRLVKVDSREDYRSWYDVVKPIADRFNIVMKDLMVPGKFLNIERETVLHFNEKNMFVEKPERIRMHLLSDDHGIFQRVFVVDPELQQEVRGDTIARTLMEDFLDSGRSLMTPNMFYISVTMAEDFLKRKTYLTGLLKKNRPRNPNFLKMKPNSAKLPIRVEKMESPNENTAKDKKLKGSKNDIMVIQGFNQQGVCVCRIIKREVKINLLSTEYDAKPAENKKFECDMLEQTFNHTNWMKRDSLLSKCGPVMKSKFNRHISYILQGMIVNAYLMFKVKTGKKIKFVNFLEEILYQMLPLNANEKDKENIPKQKKKPVGRRNEGEDNCIVV